jgi:hypothetical protein
MQSVDESANSRGVFAETGALGGNSSLSGQFGLDKSLSAVSI